MLFAAVKRQDEVPAETLRYLRDFVLDGPQQDELSTSMANAAAKRLVSLAVIGIVLEAHREQGEFDAARQQIAHELSQLAIGRGRITRQAFGGWIYPFALLYLIERELAGSESIGSSALVVRIQELQNAEGGWGHTLGTATNFYPSTLVATTNLALLALGLARRSGLEVEDEALEDGFALLERVQGAHGGMPYGGPFYLKGFEVGRTAASLLALAAIDRQDHFVFERAVSYTLRNPSRVPDGHASPALHVYLGSHAFALLGNEAWQDYRGSVLKEVLAAHQPEGDFEEIRGRSPDTMFGGRSAAAEIDRAYIAAMYAGGLQARQTRWLQSLRSLLEPGVDKFKRPDPITAWPLPKPQWRTPVGATALIRPLGDRLIRVAAEGAIEWHDAQRGRRINHHAVASPAEDQNVELKTLQAGDHLFVVRELEANELELTERLLGGGGASPPASQRELFALTPAGLAWTWKPAAALARITAHDGVIHALLRNGRIESRSLADGALQLTRGSKPILVNAALTAGREGRVIFAAENRMRSLAADGFEAWTKRTRGRRGITPPAWTALCSHDASVFSGTSAGLVAAWDEASGKPLWKAELAGSIADLAYLEKPLSTLLVQSHDGRVAAFEPEDGRLRWSIAFTQGAEWARLARWQVHRDRIWVHHGLSDTLSAIDPETGRVLRRYALPRNTPWCFLNEALYTVEDDRLVMRPATDL